MLARNTLASWSQYAVAVASALLLTPLVIRGVGEAAYGVWILLTQLTGYAGLLDFGVQPAVAREIARAHATNDRERVKEILRAALWLQILIAVAALCLAALLAPWLARWFDLGGLDRGEASTAFSLVVVAATLSLPANLFAAGLRGHQRLDLVAFVGVASQLTRIAGTLLALSFAWGVTGLALAHLAANLVGLAGGWTLLRLQVGSLGLVRVRPSSNVLRGLLSFGAYAFIGSAGWYLIYSTDAVLIGALLTAADVAHFGLAANVLIMVSAIVGGFTASFLPLAGESSGRDDSEGTRRHYLVGTRMSLLLGLPFAAALALEGPSLLALWVGPAVGIPAGRLLRVLALAHIPPIANGVGLPIALGSGYARRAAGLILAEGFMNLALSLALARRFGTLGVAFGTLLPSLAFSGILWPGMLSRRLGSSLPELWHSAFLPNLQALAAGSTAFLLVYWLPIQGAPGLVLRVSTLVVAYWATALFTCFSEAERKRWRLRLVEFR